MADFKLEAVIFSFTCCFLLCTAVRQSPRETHIGYLYDKPGHTLEVPIKDFEESEEEPSIDEGHIQEHSSDHHHKPHDEYLPPKSHGFGHHSKGEDEHHHIRVHNEKRNAEKNEKKSVKEHEVSSQGQGGGGFTRKSSLRFTNKEK